MEALGMKKIVKMKTTTDRKNINSKLSQMRNKLAI